MTLTFTREQLYTLVWSQPIEAITKRTGISRISIVKNCRMLNVPIPKRNYWGKLRTGKPVIQAPLPNHDLQEVQFRFPELRQGEAIAPQTTKESLEDFGNRLRHFLGPLPVPDNFCLLHPAVADLLMSDEKRRERYKRNRHLPVPHFDDPFERRRLLFINGLFLGFSKIGGVGSFRNRHAYYPEVSIPNSTIAFRVDRAFFPWRTNEELMKLVQEEPKLELAITDLDLPEQLTASWRDGDDCHLEDQLADVIAGMVVVGEQLIRRRLERKAERKRQEREMAKYLAERQMEEDRRHKRRQSVAAKQAKTDRLIRDAAAWHQAKQVREYVKAVQSAAQGVSGAQTLEAWLQWALIEADKLDPIVSGRALRAYIGSDNPFSL